MLKKSIVFPKKYYFFRFKQIVLNSVPRGTFRVFYFLEIYGLEGSILMKLSEAVKTVQPKYISILKWFLFIATLIAIIGIFVVLAGEYRTEARYLTILAATVACQGVWGMVLCDCVHRRNAG